MDDELNFRALLIQLQDGLSDHDRQRLHFLLGYLIPAHLRDDLTMGGTLNLLQNLLNLNKMSEQDVTFLIRVFHKIHCHSIVQVLQRHQGSQQRQQQTNQSELSQQSNTLLNRLLADDNEDRMAISSMNGMIELDPVSTCRPSTVPPTSLSAHNASPTNLSASIENEISSFMRFYRILKRKASKYVIPALLLNIVLFILGITFFILVFKWRSTLMQQCETGKSVA